MEETWNNPQSYQQRYNVSGTAGDIFNFGVAGWADAFHSYTMFGDTNASSNLLDEIFGINSQKREFAQQEYLQDKMNAYNLPVNQMQRMRDAGINPNLAAAGIAGSGSESAQAPAVSSNTSGAAQGLGALASVASGVKELALLDSERKLNQSSADAQGATARLNDATANRTNSLVDYERNVLISTESKNLADAGLSKYQANYWSVKAAYADSNEIADLQLKGWALKKAEQDVENLKQDVKLKKQQLKLDKLRYTEQEYKNEIARIDSVVAKGIEDVYNSLGVDIRLPENAILLEAYQNGHLDNVLDVFSKGVDNTARAMAQVELDTIQEKTRKVVQEQYKATLRSMIMDQQFKKELMEIGFHQDQCGKIINFLNQKMFGTGWSAKVGPFGGSQSNP